MNPTSTDITYENTETTAGRPAAGVGTGALLGVARALRNQLAIFAKDYSGPTASLMEESGHVMQQLIDKIEAIIPPCECVNGIVRSLGRDNDEVIEDCPRCSPPNTLLSDRVTH